MADDNVTAITGDHKKAKFMDLGSGAVTATFTPRKRATWRTAIAPNGKVAATGARDKLLHIVDSSGKELAALAGHSKPITRVAFTRNGKFVVSSSGDGTVRMWDWSNEKEIMCVEVARRPVEGMAMSRDATIILTGSNDRKVRIIDVATGNVTHESITLDAMVQDVAISDDGAVGYSCGGMMHMIQVWRLK